MGLLICVTYFLLMLIPSEVYFQINTIRIEPYRIYLIVAALVLLPKVLLKHKFSLAEKFLIFYCVWCTLSFLVNHGPAGLQSGAILFLEILVGYLVGSSIKGDINALKKFIFIVLLAFLVLIPFAVSESLTGYRYLHVAAANIVNTPVEVYLGDSYFRYGLHRASTIFSHPILYSVCAVAILPVVYFLFNKVKASVLSMGVFVAMITSVTSAGFVMFGIQLILYSAKKVQIYVPNIFKIILYVTTISYVLIAAFSNRGPILVFISFASLNPATAFARYMQWQYAADDISSNPFFGIGFFEWSRPFWMSSSVDSYWLLSALQNGYPAIFTLGTFIILTAIKYWQEWKKSNNDLYFVFFTIVFSIAFAGFTVDFFDRAQLFMFMLIGMFSSFISHSEKSRV